MKCLWSGPTPGHPRITRINADSADKAALSALSAFIRVIRGCPGVGPLQRFPNSEIIFGRVSDELHPAS